MSTQLDTILASTRAELKERRERVAIGELEQRASMHQPRGWADALRARARKAPAVIAELKKASPSKGLIREDFDVAWLAGRYAAGDAAALSVLTESHYFQGSLENLEVASKAASLPCLRKDFTVDEYQVIEARAHHADAVLLIAAALSDKEMEQLISAAHDFELDVLCEVHSSLELDRVLALAEPPEAIGVNNRDLTNFAVDLAISYDLVDRIPSTLVRVTESGISDPADVAQLRRAGYDAFLIGESLMREPDPAKALQQLLQGEAASAGPGRRR